MIGGARCDPRSVLIGYIRPVLQQVGSESENQEGKKKPPDEAARRHDTNQHSRGQGVNFEETCDCNTNGRNAPSPATNCGNSKHQEASYERICLTHIQVSKCARNEQKIDGRVRIACETGDDVLSKEGRKSAKKNGSVEKQPKGICEFWG